MIVLKESTVLEFIQLYGDENMIGVYSEPRGFSAISNQAILLVDSEKLIILFINKITNKIIQKIEFQQTEITNTILKRNLFFSDIWQFEARKQKWIFRIPTSLPLKKMNQKFIDSLHLYNYI